MLQRLTVALLAMAVSLGLVHGRTLGYLCDCGDTARLIAVPDCHQLECHPHHRHADGCDDTRDLPTGGADHSHEHRAVEDQPDWSASAPGPASVPAMAPEPVALPTGIGARPGSPLPRVLPGSFIPPPPRRTFLNSVLLI